MSRKRIEGTALKTYEDADAALRKIGVIDRDLGLIEAAMNEGIEKLKQGAKERAEPLKATKASLERHLKEFAESHRADFSSARTRELTFGSIGFRRSSSVLIKSIGDTLAALKGLGLAQCIRIKEEPDKEAMRELSTETLASVGASLKVADTFGYEIKREEIAQLPEPA